MRCRVPFALSIALLFAACGDQTNLRAGVKCETGDVCEEGATCFGGTCRPNLGSACDERVAQCMPGGACQGGVCKGVGGSPCDEKVRCALNFACEDGSCVAEADGACGDEVQTKCATGLVCAEGKCRVAEGGACDDGARQCVAPLVCSEGVCGYQAGGACRTAGTCVSGYECESGSCRGEAGSACGEGVDCLRGFVCESGRCRGGTGSACVETSDCATGWSCENRVCKAGAGEPCHATAECGEGFVCHAGKCEGGPGAPCDATAPCAPGGVCELGLCKVPKGGDCDALATCATGLSCVDKRCRVDIGQVCVGTADCAPGLTCEEERCRAGSGGGCEADPDCLTGLACDAGVCKGVLGAPCDAPAGCGPGLTCDGGTCLVPIRGSCTTAAECADAALCTGNTCLVPSGGACAAVADCGPELTCEAGFCVAVPGGDCDATHRCATNLTCVAGTCRSSGGGACASDAECLTGLTCEGGICKAGAAGGCSATSPCLSGLACEDGSCREPPMGACTKDAECPSQHVCADGVCAGAAGAGCDATLLCAPGLGCTGDKCRPTVGFAKATLTAKEDAGDVSLEVVLSAASDVPVTLPYSVGGTATSADFTLADGTLTIPAGQTKASIPLAISADPMDEPDETVVVTLGIPTGAVLGATTVTTVTIEDDDAPPLVRFTQRAMSVDENASTAPTIGVELSAPSAFPVRVNLVLSADGSATNDIDFRYTATGFAFAPGETAKSFDVTLVNDNVSEGDEKAIFVLQQPDHATLGTPSSCELTIVDDEPMPDIAFVGTSASVAEGDSVQVEVRSTVVLPNPITVTYALAGTSTSADWTLPARTATIRAGTRSTLITVKTVQDLLDEDDETLELALTATSPGNLVAPQKFTVTIVDDDAKPQLGFTTFPPTYEENAGQGMISLVLSAPSGREVRAKLAVGGTATNPADHDLAEQTVTFPAGATRVDVPFHIVDDTTVESDERINVAVSGLVNADPSPMSYSYAAIEDNDSGRYANVTDIAMGGGSGAAVGCALADGEPRCWGAGAYNWNALGDGGADHDYAKKVTGSLANASSICVGASYGCYVAGGAVWCWGASPGPSFRYPYPLYKVPAFSSDVTAVSCGGGHLCAIVGTELQCLGSNGYGQLGDGTRLSRSDTNPVTVPGLTNVTAVAAGNSHTCAVADGGTYCWGSGMRGEAAQGSGSLVPVKVLDEQATSLSAASLSTCAVVNGAVYCWGDNQAGQLSDAVALGRAANTPAAITQVSSGATAVAAGDGGTCAVVRGKVRCWGTGIVNADKRAPVLAPTLPWSDSELDSGVTAIAMGAGGACAVRDTKAKCWGVTDKAVHGARADLDQNAFVPVLGLPATATGFVGLQFIDGGGCAGLGDGLTCWGTNLRTLGLFEDLVMRAPTRVAAFGAPASGIGFTTIAHPMAAGGALFPFSSGVLAASAGGLPTPMTGWETGVTDVVSGTSHTCAAKDGLVKCWGNNTYGELGVASPSYADESTPVTVPGITQASKLGANQHATCAQEGTGLKCWGWPLASSTPTPVVVGAPVKTFAISYDGDFHVIVVGTDGTVWRAKNDTNLAQVPGVTNVTDISTWNSAVYVVVGGAVKQLSRYTPYLGDTVVASGATELARGNGQCGRVDGKLGCFGRFGPFGYGSGRGWVDYVPVQVLELRRPQ